MQDTSKERNRGILTDNVANKDLERRTLHLTPTWRDSRSDPDVAGPVTAVGSAIQRDRPVREDANLILELTDMFQLRGDLVILPGGLRHPTVRVHAQAPEPGPKARRERGSVGVGQAVPVKEAVEERNTHGDRGASQHCP